MAEGPFSCQDRLSQSPVAGSFSESAVQITVPINPGNSGGPLFDDDGRVVGVNTFTVRKNRTGDLALEALNFALEAPYVHALLSDKSQSLDDAAITQVVRGKEATTSEDGPLVKKLKARLKEIMSRGYRPYGGDVEKSTRVLAVPANDRRTITVQLVRGERYVVSVISQGAGDVDLAVVSEGGTVIAADVERDPEPVVEFECRVSGLYAIVVINPSGTEGAILLSVFEK